MSPGRERLPLSPSWERLTLSPGRERTALLLHIYSHDRLMEQLFVKNTGVHDNRFHTLVENVMLGTLGDTACLENWVRGNVTRMSEVITSVQKNSLPSGRDPIERRLQGRLTLSPDRERLI